MKIRFIAFSCVLLLLLAIVVHATDRIVPSKDMTYLGAFKLPDPGSASGYSYYSRGLFGNGITFYPGGNSGNGSLFVLASKIVDGSPVQYVTEVSLATPKTGALGGLNTATLLKSPFDITDGRQVMYTQSKSILYLPKQGTQSTDKLYWGMYAWYQYGDIYSHLPLGRGLPNNGFYGWAELDGSLTQGMWQLANGDYVPGIPPSGSWATIPSGGYQGQYLLEIPSDWADTYVGGKYLAGGKKVNYAGSLFAFAPWQSCGGSPANCDTNPTPDAIHPGGTTGYFATSTTSNSISTGTKTFAVESGLSFTAGMRVRAISWTSDGRTMRFMTGAITSYSGTTLVMNTDRVYGSGTYTTWLIETTCDPVGWTQVATYPCNALPFVPLLAFEEWSYATNPNFSRSEKNAAVRDMYHGWSWLTLGDKRALVASGTKTYRYLKDFAMAYAYPPAWDPDVAEGYHSVPGSGHLWFYDQDDITAVACTAQASPPAGCSGIPSKQPYEPQPYAMVDLRSYMYSTTSYVDSTLFLYFQTMYGLTYDKVNNKLYVEEVDPTHSTYIIHVWQLADSLSTTLDTTPPSAPVLSLTNASKSLVSMSWTASTDGSGKPVTYRLYRNGLSIAVMPSTKTTFTDTWVQYYIWPIEYRVDAVDFEGNIAASNILTVGEADGGQAPMTMFITACFGPNIHETSQFPTPILGIPYSYTIGVVGGTPPYVWTSSGWIGYNWPTGLTLDPSTGTVNGTTNVGGNKFVIITLTDANGNVHKRMATISPLSNVTASWDRDGEGRSWLDAIPIYRDTDHGGQDTDDLTCNIIPGYTALQPPPTNLVVAGYSLSTISLNWTEAFNRNDPAITPHNFVGGSGNDKLGDKSYMVYYGTSSGNYDHSLFVGGVPSYTVSCLSNGTYYFAVAALDWYGLESNKSNEVSATLDGGGCFVIITSSLPGGTVGQSYSQALSVVGGTPPYSWSVISGSLPSGLSLGSLGSITGIPSSAGTYGFTVQVSDSSQPANSTSKSLSIVTAQGDSEADLDQNGCIDLQELLSFISRWRVSSSDVSISDVVEAIGLWKGGCP